jgi:nucleoside-diphosphate-sugar epimerase
MSPVLILGARSWTGFRLTEAILKNHAQAVVLGTTTSQNLKSIQKNHADFEFAQSSDDFKKIIQQKNYSTVINLLRGEDAVGLDIHRQVATECFKAGIRYVYASSALALDGYNFNQILTEDLPAKSITPYGQFKGACEDYLEDLYPNEDWLALRFSSIQGWSPWKPSRNEAFLTKLKQAQVVKVSRGIKQNRLYDEIFAQAVVQLINQPDARGIFHLGTVDQSEEIDFLQAVAKTFGYEESGVQADGERKVNLSLSCNRLHQATANQWRQTEAQTLTALVQEPHLSRLRKN